MSPAATTPGSRFWVGLALGWALIGFGIAGAVGDAAKTMPSALAIWVLGAGVIHDLAIAPLVLGAGWLVVRLVPPGMRRPVTVGTVLSAFVLLVGWIPLRGYGDRPSNPTLHPIDYRTSVLTALGAIWLLVAGWAVASRWRRRGTVKP
ncbi:MAG: hypothetical protein ACRDWD_15970 [Acidimicrobiia bacterium]